MALEWLSQNSRNRQRSHPEGRRCSVENEHVGLPQRSRRTQSWAGGRFLPPTLGTRSDSNTILQGLKLSFFNPYRVDNSLGVIPGVGRKKRVQPRALFWCPFRAQSEPASDLGRTDYPSALLSWSPLSANASNESPEGSSSQFEILLPVLPPFSTDVSAAGGAFGIPAHLRDTPPLVQVC